jgi:hypothetical protein
MKGQSCPLESLDGPVAKNSTQICHLADKLRSRDQAKNYRAGHFVGTIRLEDSSLLFDLYYLEFEARPGGCYFGGRNGQLDFRDIKFDWNSFGLLRFATQNTSAPIEQRRDIMNFRSWETNES